MGAFCAKSGATLLSPVTFSKVLAGLKISCGRGFGPRLAKFIVTWTHFAQNLAQPFLCPVTFSEVLAGPLVTFSEVLGGLGGSREPFQNRRKKITVSRAVHFEGASQAV